ncbi:MAG: carbon-nitrogen hydrolase family protein [Deltaproteobacteria bacterium]|nr:carbon-nitrogen hydrolase family protein [Deltaproteobacteria bacterium]
MKAAAVQMTAALGEVEKNLESAKKLAEQAFAAGAEWVVLPEFFPTAMGFSPAMDRALAADADPEAMLVSLAVKHKGVVGGSFIHRRGRDFYNTFALALPDGTVQYHDKDQPTMWENCYYRGGSDTGILDTPAGPAGVALCWEMVRTRTARRLRGKVNLVVGGSCWWDLPRGIPLLGQRLSARMDEIMDQTPPALARLVGAPVVHAAHAGEFSCRLPLAPGVPYQSRFVGRAMIVDGEGNVLARMGKEDGEGFILADVEPGLVSPTLPLPHRFWIPRLPRTIRLAWAYQNAHGKWTYRLRTRRKCGEERKSMRGDLF